MSKKLLSEAQVRKFMGLANLDANVSSNFINEMYADKPAMRDEEEMEEGYMAKKDDEMHEAEMSEEEPAAPEIGTGTYMKVNW